MRFRIPRPRFQLIIAFMALLGAPTFGEAQNPQDSRPLFPQIFPNPTGMNGFEEIVQAGELAQKSKPDAVIGSGVTLAEKRRVVNERHNRQALALLRAGLAKPLH